MALVKCEYKERYVDKITGSMIYKLSDCDGNTIRANEAALVKAVNHKLMKVKNLRVTLGNNIEILDNQ